MTTLNSSVENVVLLAVVVEPGGTQQYDVLLYTSDDVATNLLAISDYDRRHGLLFKTFSLFS